MSKTISMSVGRVAVLHDVRKEISANVDEELTKNNSVFVDKLAEYNYSIEAYTNTKFQPVIDQYNDGKKNCRQIHETYTEYVQKQNEKLIAKYDENKSAGIKRNPRNTTKLCHEYVLQVGDRDSNGVTSADIEQNREYCRKVLEDIQNKYKHVDVLLATYHADEPNGTPHMHILVQFTGEEYQRGLSKQISMSKALELDGFERSQNRGDYAINRWTKDVQDTIMTNRLQEVFHEDRAVLNEGRSHDDIRIFREKAKEEAKALQEMRSEAREDVQKLEKRSEELTQSIDISEGLNTWYEGENERLESENKDLQGKNNELEQKHSQLKEKISQSSEKLAQQQDKISQMDNLTDYLTSRGNENPQAEEYTIEAQKDFLGRVKAPERHGVFIEGVTPEQIDAAFDHAHGQEYVTEVYRGVLEDAQAKGEETANELIQEAQNRIAKADEILARKDEIIQQGKDEYNRIADLHNDVLERYNNLLDEKEELENRVDKLKTEVESYSNMHSKYQELQRAVDIAEGKLKYNYLKERFKDDSHIRDYSYYRDRGELIALYKDGTIRQVGRNEHNGMDNQTLADKEAGLCEVGIIEDEPQVKIPKRLLKEVEQSIPQEEMSHDLKEYIRQQNQVQSARMHLSM